MTAEQAAAPHRGRIGACAGAFATGCSFLRDGGLGDRPALSYGKVFNPTRALVRAALLAAFHVASATGVAFLIRS
ncbi:hypothetical protein AB0B45_09265 [Nonomuraea sp. NPDC049152]|uniref:hypothetical protein n=1 Tax=Nonomuraea sp. NPDC049152 TaxID=3154350 RepID=UPI0033D9A24E